MRRRPETLRNFDYSLRLARSETRKRSSDDIELDMDRLVADEALECTNAYYQSALKLFTENVTQQVVERHLISTLADSFITPVQVVETEDTEIRRIAGEPTQLMKQRKMLEQRKQRLEAGQATFKRAPGEMY